MFRVTWFEEADLDQRERSLRPHLGQIEGVERELYRLSFDSKQRGLPT
jgi:hypothetical protein